MNKAPQREQFIKAHIEYIHANLRLLETLVTSPIGLSTDLKSLREAMNTPEASEERDRQAFRDLARSDTAYMIGLRAAALIEETMILLSEASSGYETPLPLEWQSRASKILKRIKVRLGGHLRTEKAQAINGVYVIIDAEWTNGRPVSAIADAILSGGASAIQLRDKSGDNLKALEAARIISGKCGEAGAIFIVNDRPDIAVLSNADGVHLGQHDLPPSEARSVILPQQLIGKSNATIQEALEAQAESVDYLAVGAIFNTETKRDTRDAGLETLQEVKRTANIPVVAIGGIDVQNASQVIAAGADAVCVASAVTQSIDPEAATRDLVAIFN